MPESATTTSTEAPPAGTRRASIDTVPAAVNFTALLNRL